MADELNKLKIRRSVIRERMNVIGGLEDISEAVIKEEKELRAEYQKLEVGNVPPRSDRKRPTSKQKRLSRMMTRKARSWPSLGKA